MSVTHIYKRAYHNQIHILLNSYLFLGIGGCFLVDDNEMRYRYCFPMTTWLVSNSVVVSSIRLLHTLVFSLESEQVPETTTRIDDMHIRDVSGLWGSLQIGETRGTEVTKAPISCNGWHCRLNACLMEAVRWWEDNSVLLKHGPKIRSSGLLYISEAHIMRRYGP